MAIAPQLDARARLFVEIERVRIRLYRGGGAEALDTTVVFPPGADSLALQLEVQIVEGASETFDLLMQMIDANGDTVFVAGPTPITAVAGVLTPPVASPEFAYVGVGANAALVRFTQAPGAAFFGDTVLFVAEAVDSSGQVIPNTPITFSSSDTSRATVPDETVGRVVARTTRGTVQITAALLTPPTVTAPLAIQPRPTAIIVLSGSGQAGTVGAPLAQPIVARVRATDNLGVQGVPVTFVVAGGGGTVSQLVDTTDANGDASVTWTLGTVVGAQSVTATAAGVAGQTASFTATAAAAAARALVFTVEPVSAQAGAVIVPAVQVTARDTFGNTAEGFTGPVTVALGANPGGSTLAGTLTVNAVAGVATFSTLSLNRPGTGYTLVATATGLAPDTSVTFGITPSAPARLAFSVEPTNANSGAPITPAIQVQVLDGAGNLVPTATDSVTLSILANPGGGTLAGTTRVAAVAGIATFSTIAIDRAGAGYTLAATGTGLVPDTSAAFSISSGPAVRLAVTTEPAATQTAGVAFPVGVTALDAAGNTATDFTGTVTLALGANPGADTLGGTISAAAVAGVAALSPSLRVVASGYTIVAATAGLTPDTTVSFAVSPAPATSLTFTSQPPASLAAGAPIAATVTARDAFGNVAAGFTDSVTVALGTNPTSDTLQGTVRVPAIAGVATFGPSLRRAGSGYTLAASASGLTGATSTAFAITPAIAASLVFTTQPPATHTAGTAFSVGVTARDAFGNTVASFVDAVTVALGTNPPADTLLGTLTQSAAGGTATFADLRLRKSAIGFTLVATSGALTGATSNPFSIQPAPPVQLVFTQQPVGGTAGAPLAPPITVAVQDSLGNVVASFVDSVTIALDSNPGGATLGGTVRVAATGGIATFSTLTLDRAGTGYRFAVSASGVAGTAQSAMFAITPAAATQLVFTTPPPATQPAGQAIPVAVTARDAFGNTVTGYAGTVTLAIGTNPASGTLGGTLSVPAVGGVATFSDPFLDKAGSGYTLAASAPGLSGATSGSFAITPAGATRLVFSAQPPASQTAGEAFAVTVAAQDSFANLDTAFAGSVGVALAANPGGSTLGGTGTVAAAGGLATFTGLTLDRSGSGYTLAATAAGLTPDTSSTFAIVPAAPALLVLTTPPPDTVIAGAAFTVAATARDTLGNAVTSYTGDVTLALAANPGGATLGGTLTVAAASGVATFTTPTLDRTGGGYTLVVTAAGLAPDTTAGFTVRAAPPSALILVSGSAQTDTVAATLALPLVVRVTDALGNGIAGDTVTFATGTGSVGSPTAVTDATGHAQTTWTLGTTAGAQSATATRSGLTGSPATFTATATPASPAALVFTTPPPDSVIAGAPFGAALAVRDGFGNTVGIYTDSLFLSLATNPTGDTLGGTRRVAMAGGTATFTDLALQLVGSGYTIQAQSGALSATSTGIVVQAAAAAALTIVSGNAQTDTVAQQLANPLVVKVTDALGNPIAGDTVAFAAGAGSVGSPIAVTDAAGLAQTTWTLGTTAGTQTASATRAGLTGSPAAFSASALHDTPYRLAFTGQPTNTVAGDTITPPVTVAVQDSFGNVATSFPDTTTIAVSLNQDIVLSGNRFKTATAGVVTYDDLSVNTAFTYRLQAFAAGLLADSSALFTVSAGTAQSLSLYTGNSQSGNIGAALPFPLQVRAADQFNNGVAGVTVSWSTADGSLPATSVTDAQGVASATWTLGGTVGTQTAQASATGLTGSPVTFTASAVPAGVSALWTGQGGSSWDNVGSWSTGTVPTTADTVWIPVSAVLQPEVFQADSIGGLLVEAGASVQVYDSLTVKGRIDAGFTSIGGPGVLIAANQGPGALPLRGSFSRLRIAGSYTVLDSVLTSDSLVVGDGGQLDVTGIVRVGSQFFMDSVGTGGRLVMDDPGGLLDVAGSATFASPLSMFLSAGTLRLGGDLVQIKPPGGVDNNFAAGSGHTTVFQGGGSQRVRMQTPLPGTGSRLGSVQVAIGDGSLILDGALGGILVALEGDLDIQEGGVGDTIPLFVFGDITTAAGTSINLGQLSLRGALSVAGSYNVALTQFSGTGQTIPALPYQSLAVQGTATLGADVAALLVAVNQPGSALTVGGHTLTVSGQLIVGDAGNPTIGGRLVMTNAADSVDAANVLFGGDDATDILTAGTLVVRQGQFRQVAHNAGQTFVASGTHQTVIQSSEVGISLLMESGGPTTSHFQHLRTIGATTDPVHLGPGRTYVAGDLRAGTTMDGPGTDTLSVVGVADFAGWDLTLNRLEVGDSLVRTGSSFYNVGTTAFYGSGQRIPNGLSFGNVEVFGTASTGGGAVTDASGTLTVLGASASLTVADSSVVSVVGQVTVDGGLMALADTAKLYAVSGFRTIAGGRLSQAGSSQVVVQGGETRFEGGSTDGLMTGGTLDVPGVFVQGGHPQSFAPSGSHVTRFAGTGGVQEISFANPDATASRFHHLRILTPQDTVALRTAAWATGDVFLADSLTGGGVPVILGGVGPLNVAGNFTMVTTSGQPITVVPAALRLFGALSDVGSGTSVFRPDTVVFAGTSQAVPTGATYQYQNLVVEGSASITSFLVNTAGDFIVRGTGLFEFRTYGGANVGGAFRTEGGGRATMSHFGSTLTVANGASFRGGNSVLTDGQIVLNGGGFEQAVNADAFQATAPHVTVLNNSLTYDLRFEHPDTGFTGTGSHFGHLELQSGFVTAHLLTDVAANGQLIDQDYSNTAVSGDATLHLRGAQYAGFGLVVDTTRIVFSDGDAIEFASVTFQNQPVAADQLVIRRSDATITMADLAFGVTPTSGHYVWVDKQGAGAQTVDFQSPMTPASPGTFVRRTGTPLPTVLWGGTPLASSVRWGNTAGGSWNVGSNWVGGNVPLTVDTAVIDTAGTYTITVDAPTEVGYVMATQGTIDLSGNRLLVNNTFATAGSATVTMADPADTLRVVGNAAFGGASTTGQLTAGVLQLGLGFVQSGDATSFAPSGAHRTVFDGPAGIISFEDPGTSAFNRLHIANWTGSIQLLSNARVLDTLKLIGSTAVLTGGTPYRLRTEGHVSGGVGTTFTPFVWEKAGITFVDSGTVSPDTTVFLASGDTVRFGSGFATYAWNNLRIAADTVRIHSASIATNQASRGGDVTIGGLSGETGTLALSGFGPGLTVNGNLRTEGLGALKQHVPSGGLSSVTVTGSATFAGRSTASELLSGQLSVAGAFVQSAATSAAAFAPSGTHRTVLSGSGAQTVTFASPGTSAFEVLQLASTSARSVVLQSNVTVNDSLIALGGAAGTDLVGQGTTEHMRVNGVLRLTNGTAAPLVAPPVLEVQSPFDVDSIFQVGRGLSPDTTVFFGAGGFNLPIGTPVRYKSLTIVTDSPLAYAPFGGTNVTLSGDLTLGGPSGEPGVLSIESSDSLIVTGGLRTLGTGYLRMQTAGGVLTVNGEARFEGGSTDGQLTAGALRLIGNFLQSDVTSRASFRASGTHRTISAGSGNVNASFATTDSSRFDVLEVNRPSGQFILTGPASAADTLLIASGWFVPSGNSMTAGTLRTIGSGVLRMVGATDSVDVAGNATFAGQTSAGHLSAGTLVLRAGFQQLSTQSASSFQASVGHRTVFAGTASQLVSFAAPGFGASESRFGTLRNANTNATGIQIDVLGITTHAIEDLTPAQANRFTCATICSGGLATRGTDLQNTVINALNLLADTGDGAGAVQMANVQFTTADGSATPMLSVTRAFDVGTITLDSVRFDSTPGSQPYVRATQAGAGGPGFTLALTNAGPNSPGLRYETVNGASLIWNGGLQAGSVSWIGPTTGTQLWGTASNWSTNAVPTSTQTVVITANGGWDIVLDEASTIAALVLGNGSSQPILKVQAGGQLTVSDSADVASNATLALEGGTVDGAGTLDVAGTLALRAGTLAGTGTARILSGAQMLIDSASGSPTISGRLVQNAGDIFWTASTDVSLSHPGTGVVIENAGTFGYSAASSQSLLVSGGTPQVVNTATGTMSVFHSNSANVFAVDAAYRDTTGTITVSNGTLRLNGGGRLGGSKTIPSGGVLELAGGTLTTQAATTVAGAGLLRIAGGTFSPDSSRLIIGDEPKFSVTNLDLTGGTVATEGWINIFGTANWTGGSLFSNAAGIGGVLNVDTNATLTISGATAKNISGPFILENRSSIVFSQPGNIAMSNAATAEGGINNISGSLFDWQGDGQITCGNTKCWFYNETGAVLRRSTSGNPAVMSFVLDNEGGALQVNSGTLRFTNGSPQPSAGFELRGTATVAGGSLLDLAGGTFTLGGPGGARFAVTGTLQVSGSTGIVVLNGRTLAVTGNFLTATGGRVTMANALDSLIVTGTASFNGGTSTLSAGTVTVGGDFTQAITATSYQAGASHTTVLNGTGAQTVNFANPAASGASRFGNLQLANGSVAGITLGDSVYVVGLLSQPAASVTISSTNRKLFAANVDLDGVTFSNTRLGVEADVPTAITQLDNVTFTGMSANATQLSVQRTSGTNAFNGVIFDQNPTGRTYVSAFGGSHVVNLVNPTPASSGGLVSLADGASVIVNGGAAW